MIRKNVIVKHELQVGETIFKRDMKLRFSPNQMKVKYVFYLNDATGIIPLLIKSSIVHDYICVCSDSENTQIINTTFDLNDPVQGIQDFTIHDINGALLATEEGSIFIHLEFIKNI